MMKKVISLAVLSALFFSCSKEQETGRKNDVSLVDTEVYEKYKEASNPENPWEHYGLIHNDILDELKSKKIEKPTMFSKKVNQLDVTINYTLEKFDEKYGNSVMETGKKSSVDEIKHILNDGENFYTNVIDEYTKDIKNVHIAIKDLFQVIERYSKDTFVEYADLKADIVAIESKIIEGDYFLSEEEKDFVLKITSIARHSFYYWSSQQKIVSKTGKRPLWKWIVVGAADIAGGITGSVAGALGASAGASTLVDWVAPDSELKENNSENEQEVAE